MASWYVLSPDCTCFSSKSLLGTNHTVEFPFGVFILISYDIHLMSGLRILCRQWLRGRLPPLLQPAIRRF